VDASTRKRVLAVARQLDYHPNLLARHFRSQQSDILGIIVPNVYHHFFSHIVSVVTDLARQSGYVLLVCQSNERLEQEVQNVQVMLQKRVAGLLVSISLETRNLEHFRSLERHRVPLVFFDRVIKGVVGTQVVVDNIQGAHEAVSHLLRLGRRRIAHVAGDLDLPLFRDRYLGYRQALKAHNVPAFPSYVIPGGLTEEDGIRAAKSLLKLRPRPDAVFAVDDRVALGLMTQLRQTGVAVPEEVALVGFDNDPMTGFLQPALTTVEQPKEKMAQRAMSLLLERINGKGEKSHREVLKTRLVIRESCGETLRVGQQRDRYQAK
jgi:DNA-binding LacI/PurR family transcriptional regulator